MADADIHRPEFGYPYAPNDGRENLDAPPSAARVVQGGSWYFNLGDARAAARFLDLPADRDSGVGFRVVRASPILPEPLAAGAA